MINASVMHTHCGSFNIASTGEVEAFIRQHGRKFPNAWVTDILLLNGALNGPDGGDEAIVAYYKKWGAKKVMCDADYAKPPAGVNLTTRWGRFNVANKLETDLFLTIYDNRFTAAIKADVRMLSEALQGDQAEAADVLARFNKRWANIMLPEATA